MSHETSSSVQEYPKERIILCRHFCLEHKATLTRHLPDTLGRQETSSRYASWDRIGDGDTVNRYEGVRTAGIFSPCHTQLEGVTARRQFGTGPQELISCTCEGVKVDHCFLPPIDGDC